MSCQQNNCNKEGLCNQNYTQQAMENICNKVVLFEISWMRRSTKQQKKFMIIMCCLRKETITHVHQGRRGGKPILLNAKGAFEKVARGHAWMQNSENS